MHRLAKTLVFGLFTYAVPPTLATDDYIWEEKFKKEMANAEQDQAKSQYSVGEMYEKGKGTEKAPQKAFHWYSKAAGQGDKKAAYKVGLAYLEGLIVAKNTKQALDWLRKSANQKYVRAQYTLGQVYENGRGVSKNHDEALKWYKRAFAGGYGAAADGINRVARIQKSSTVPRNVAIPQAKSKAVVRSSKDKVLAGGWKKRKKPAEYLPSAVTTCKKKHNNLECISKELTRNIGMADIHYSTQATISSFKPDGSFTALYRNKVTQIKVTDEEFATSGEPMPVKLGWQDAEHKLACKFENDKTLLCTKNKLRKVKLTR
jgi:hypothetical protein